MRNTIYVTSAIIIQNGKALATQRGYGDYAGWWEFPGGKIEAGETPEEALVREIREELKVEIVIDRYFVTTEYDYPRFHLLMKCYLCTLTGQDIVLTEHLSAAWFSREDAFDRKWLAADLPVIEKLLDDRIL